MPLCFPHFGDQPMNANNFIDNGAGLSLINTKLAERVVPPDENRTFKKPIFTARDVAEKLERLLTEDIFAVNLLKMKIAAAAAGGGDKAVDIMEDFFVESLMLKPGKVYLEHKADEHYVTEMRKTGYCAMHCSWFCTVLFVLFSLCVGFPGFLHLDQWDEHYSFFGP